MQESRIFYDDDFGYVRTKFNYPAGTDAEVKLVAMKNRTATEATIPATVVREYIYYIVDDTGIVITNYQGQCTCRVTSIEQEAFSGCSGLTSVTIPDSVTIIGPYAFSNCTHLASVTIGNGVMSIGDGAFNNCISLANVRIDGNVTNDWTSRSRPFYGCTNIETLELGEKMTKIGPYMFYDCSKLASVTIPSSVQSIGNYAFNNCTALKSVDIGNGVTCIGAAAFQGSGLTNVTIPNSVTSIEVNTFGNCISLTHANIPNSVTGIGAYAFRYSGLTSITIPNSVASIGNNAFNNCSGLTNVTILGNVTNDWGASSSPFYDCTHLATLVLGEGMTKIGNYMFYGCSGLTNMTIGNSVAWIGDSAFSGSGLTSVMIPNSVTRIGSSAFAGCRAATNVMISASVTNIGAKAFYACSSMEAFSVASGNPAYKSVDGLLLTKDGKTLLYGVNGDVVIPNGVTELTSYAFRDCAELTSVTIPDSVVRLPTEAFDGCDKLWTSWYRTLANLAASGGSSGGGSSGGSGRTVSLSVTNVIVHYVTQSIQSDMVVPNTNSTGIVNIVAEVVANKAVAIPSAWADQYPAFGEMYGTDLSAALTMQTGKQDGAGKPVFVWQDYVAGTDPTDPTSVFTASVTFDAVTGEPVISWSPELPPDEATKRLYTIYGKVQMTDSDWTIFDGYARDYNFYRVTVEMR